MVWPGWWPPPARWGLWAGVPPPAPWAASAARDAWYSRHFRSRFLFPGGPLLLPRKRAAAAALQPALAPRFLELLLDHVPDGDIDRGAQRVLVGVLVLLNPVGAQPFAGPVWPGPDPPAPLLEAKGKPFHLQPVFDCLQAVGAHVLAELEAPRHAAFALGVAVAVVLVPNQPTQ